MAILWQTYPIGKPPSGAADEIAAAFQSVATVIDSGSNRLSSNEVLRAVAPALRAIDFKVEKPGKGGRINVPVLFGLNGHPSKTFQVDAWREADGAVVEVEAGTAIDARSFYKDLFELAAMPTVRFACIAVQLTYRPNRRARTTPLRDFDRARTILETLYASESFNFPLDSLMLLGY